MLVFQLREIAPHFVAHSTLGDRHKITIAEELHRSLRSAELRVEHACLVAAIKLEGLLEDEQDGGMPINPQLLSTLEELEATMP